MRKISFICSLAALAFVAIGCGDDDVTPTPVTDAGPADLGPTDLGARDMNVPPPVDAGPPDVCAAADAAEALASWDCNGATTGPGAANGLFGACTPNADPMGDRVGSCTEGDNCFTVDGSPSPAFCIVSCTGATSALYAQTGGCPTGSRCITAFSMAGDTGYCVPSCEANSDCASGFCDSTDGSCYSADPVPDTDAGTPDAGPATDAGTPATDAGTATDAGDVDAGAIDAGPV